MAGRAGDQKNLARRRGRARGESDERGHESERCESKARHVKI
jgi:hypothetical protein